MESAEGVAAKRKVLIEALMMCLEKSRVCQVFDGRTVRSVLSSAAGELWREGEFKLDPVWQILTAQPGLTAEDVAPPLLVFKSHEGELGVQVRLPPALSAIPRGEQTRLRDTIGIPAESFQRAVEGLKAVAAEQATADAQAQIVAAAEAAAGEPTAAATTAPRRNRRPLAFALLGLAVVSIAVAAWVTLRDTASSFDLGDVAGTLQLADGRAAGPSLTAKIVDPRWESAPPEERKKLLSQVMDIEVGKGIRALTLLDAGGNMRAVVTETPDGRSIVLP